MIASVDGRIDCDTTEQIEGGNESYEALEAIPSMLMGRVTMQMHYALAESFVPNDTTPIGGEMFHIAQRAEAYCIGIDGRAGMRAVFDGIAGKNRPATRLHLNSVRQMGESVWIRYSFKN
ncbi:MAG: hypothetical protein IJB56_02160 [Alistipes sp.]|nr:hypothetical protein [Alistipes sp.]